jgi:isopentenyl-diphosphate delta-isomerase
MAKVIIVDENDVEIGVVERDEWADGAIHRVSALWLTNSRGDILLAKRAAVKKHAPNLWGCAAAGTIEEGETYDTNIIKETEEEIGVAITLDQLRKGPKVLMGQSNNRRFIQWYTGVADVALDDLRLQEDEVSEARWVPHAELLSWMREKPEEFVKTIPPSIVAELTESRASL